MRRTSKADKRSRGCEGSTHNNGRGLEPDEVAGVESGPQHTHFKGEQRDGKTGSPVVEV